MQHLRKVFVVLLGFLFGLAIPTIAMTTYTGFTQRATGYVVQAADWDNEFQNFINHYNNNVVAAFNKLATKGDIMTFDGTNVQNMPVGANGTIPQADSAQALGWKWAALANTTALTTTGDLLTFGSGALQRLGVGSDGTVLTARSTAPNGVDWEANSLPTGMIALWSGSASTIPTGWALCDGQIHSGESTPNLQGLFVVGAGNVSPPASGGMGNLSPGGPSGDNSSGGGLGPSKQASVTLTAAALASGTSNVAVGLSTSIPTSAITITPKYYALCYIMKL